MSNTTGNIARSILTSAYLTATGFGCTPQEKVETPAKPEKGDAFVQVDATQKQALNKAEAPKAEIIKNKPGELDNRDKLFVETALAKKLKALKIPLSEVDNFPKHTPETLKQVISAVEQDPKDIAAGFGGIKLAPLGKDGKAQAPKVKLAISVNAETERLKGTTLLFIDSPELAFTSADGKKDVGTIEKPLGRLYDKHGPHLRMSSGEATLSKDAVIDPKSGKLTKGEIKFNLDFISGPTKYEVTIDSKAKTSIVEPKKDANDKVIENSFNITIPGSDVVGYVPEEAQKK